MVRARWKGKCLCGSGRNERGSCSTIYQTIVTWCVRMKYIIRVEETELIIKSPRVIDIVSAHFYEGNYVLQFENWPATNSMIAHSPCVCVHLVHCLDFFLSCSAFYRSFKRLCHICICRLARGFNVLAQRMLPISQIPSQIAQHYSHPLQESIVRCKVHAENWRAVHWLGANAATIRKLYFFSVLATSLKKQIFSFFSHRTYQPIEFLLFNFQWGKREKKEVNHT